MSDRGLPELAKFMRDFWSWIKKYYEPQEPDSWWLEMMAEGNKLATDQLRTELVVAVMEDMERRYHENEVAQKKTKEQR